MKLTHTPQRFTDGEYSGLRTVGSAQLHYSRGEVYMIEAGGTVARLPETNYKTPDARDAFGRLFAAAPALYEAACLALKSAALPSDIRESLAQAVRSVD